MKYSQEERLNSVLAVIEERESLSVSALRLGVAKEQLRGWVARYREHGISGLSCRHGSYSADFKLSVLSDMRDNKLSLFETSVKYNLSRNNIQRWLRTYQQQGPSGLYPDNRGKMRKPKQPALPQTDLQKELEYLRAENAYLKKLRALVEERIARESGKKPKPSKD